MNRAGGAIAPIFPQQSIREMNRTQRTPMQVMQEAMSAARGAGWNGPIGADADHLKRREDVEATAAAGFTFFTIDPSEMVDQRADDYSPGELRDKFASRPNTPWFSEYAGQRVTLENGTEIEFDELACMRAAVKYGAAIERALQLSDDIRSICQGLGQDYEIELSVDETDQPTTLAEHYIIAQQVIAGGMKLVSLAPRFIGDLEKGVDYKGDLAQLKNSLHDHAAIARQLGPYKLSLHSGSDKLSMYGLLASATRGCFHVKTAGTSYLEALRVVARHDEPLFRRLIRFARQRYDVDRATYHVSATIAAVADEPLLSADQLENVYLQRWSDVPTGQGFTEPGRQILHCTFGSTLTDPELGAAVRGCLLAHPDTYCDVLADHFVRHLEALRSGMDR